VISLHSECADTHPTSFKILGATWRSYAHTDSEADVAADPAADARDSFVSSALSPPGAGSASLPGRVSGSSSVCGNPDRTPGSVHSGLWGAQSGAGVFGAGSSGDWERNDSG
jgi:hypothetical protein